jgi:AP2-associated kinase
MENSSVLHFSVIVNNLMPFSLINFDRRCYLWYSFQLAGSHGQSKGSAVPSRSPPLPPSPQMKEAERKAAQNGISATGAGAFWATSYAKEAKSDNGVESPRKIRSGSPGSRSRREESNHTEESSPSSQSVRKKSTVTSLIKKVQGSGWGRDEHDHNGYEMRHDSDDRKEIREEKLEGHVTVFAAPVSKVKAEPSKDTTINEFAAHFDNSPVESTPTTSKPQGLQAELDRVNKALQEALAEKAAVSSKYEKLTALCQAQQREIQGLKNALNSTSSPRPSPKGGQSPSPVSPQPQSQGPRQAPQGWQAFDQV